MNSMKAWIGKSILIVFVGLTLLGGVVVYIDPYFHFHAPLKQFQYPMDNERYQNDGITRNFEYNAIITGTSMTENFKTSEFDRLFSVNAIKIPFAGAKYKEINEALQRAIERNKSIKCIVRGLDGSFLLYDKDMQYRETYPDYLYDKWLINDVSYVFNKEVLFGNVRDVIDYTYSGQKSPSFDEYMYWADVFTYGRDAILEHYSRGAKQELCSLSTEDVERLEANLEQNVISTIKENPQIDFYIFFPPYSIYYWDELYCCGTIKKQLDAEKYTIKKLVSYENVYMYSFHDEYDMICNPNLYKDKSHYNADINSRILQWMSNGEHRLTEENYEDYCERIEQFYMTYDYDGLFEE